MEKDLQAKVKPHFYRKPEKNFKIRLGLERLSSCFRIKLFQGQTVDLKFPYLGRSRFLCSQQRGPAHLGTCNAQPIHSSSGSCQTVGGLVDTSPAHTMLPKAAIVALKGLPAWLNFISALDTGVKAHCKILMRTRNDLVFHRLIISERGGCY